MRPPRLDTTSEPLHFFGRQDVLALLDGGLCESGPSVVALVGPGGQGKTAAARHWLLHLGRPVEGAFLWSFYRGRDADACLRQWLAYAEGAAAPVDRSASYCAARLLEVLRQERWAVVLDGAEVVQHEAGDWRGRMLHPDLAWLLEELASTPLPGVVVLTSRFPLPTLEHRPYFRSVELDRLDPGSARELLRTLGVQGEDEDLGALAAIAGRHAKAVELLGTYLVHFHAGHSGAIPLAPGSDDEEASVARVLALFTRDLPPELQDLLALATTFREPPAEPLLLDYLASAAVRQLLHETWQRHYVPFVQRPRGWLAARLGELVSLRLLERVGPARVIDAHPLVRRAFEHVVGAERRESALARSGFLRGRPDRRRPATLIEAGEAIELFHAQCDAGLWAEADSTFVALEGPKYRFLAPAVERDLLLCFFPERDWRRPPLWTGFGRWRSLAISFELLGDLESALEAYRPADAALRGDALLALGRLRPLVDTPSVGGPWEALWQAYRCHALCLAGHVNEAVRLARSLVPMDIYEWAHVFECLLRAGAGAGLDLAGLLAQPADHPWADLTRRRIRADHRRIMRGPVPELEGEYRALRDAYDQAGLPLERVLVRLGHGAWLASAGREAEALDSLQPAERLARHHGLRVLEIDALEWQARLTGSHDTATRAGELRQALGVRGPCRP